MRATTQFSVLSALLISFTITFADADSPTTTPTTMPTTLPTNITWDQAKDHIGQSVTVTGPVVGAHDFGDAAVLNIGKDYPSPDRFTVYIPAGKRTGIPDDLDNGKTISVTGTLKMFHDVPEIEADAAHIKIIQQSSVGATTQP
jgi:hypothetical protein